MRYTLTELLYSSVKMRLNLVPETNFCAHAVGAQCWGYAQPWSEWISFYSHFIDRTVKLRNGGFFKEQLVHGQIGLWSLVHSWISCIDWCLQNSMIQYGLYTVKSYFWKMLKSLVLSGQKVLRPPEKCFLSSISIIAGILIYLESWGGGCFPKCMLLK